MSAIGGWVFAIICGGVLCTAVIVVGAVLAVRYFSRDRDDGGS